MSPFSAKPATVPALYDTSGGSTGGGANRALAPPKAWFSPQNVYRLNWLKIVLSLPRYN